MMRELLRHERFVLALLDSNAGAGLAAVRDHHDRRVREFQHERLIHLIVTMSTALFMLLTVGWALAQPSVGAAAMAVLLVALTAAYLVHYYRLENGVQRLYRLSLSLDERLAGRPLAAPDAPRAASADAAGAGPA